MLYIGLMDADVFHKRDQAIYISDCSPDSEDFYNNTFQLYNKNTRKTEVAGVKNIHMPSDIAINILENILRSSNTLYRREDF